MPRLRATHAVGFVTGTAIAALLAGCATSPSTSELQAAGRGPLERDQLQSLLADGATAEYESHDGASGVVTWNADGSATVDWGSGDGEGRWLVKDNGDFCHDWEFREEQECYQWYEAESEGAYLLYDGETYLSTVELQ